MSNPTYRIANWETFFETYETKKLAVLKWVPTPNKHDGLGFRRMAAQKNRCELFTAWNLILQTASKGRKSERGSLQRGGKALTPDDFAMMTGFPAPIFEAALLFFSSEEMGWLSVDNELTGSNPAEVPATTAPPPVLPAPPPAERKKEGMEWKEGKQEQHDFVDLIPDLLNQATFVEVWREWVAERKAKRNPHTKRSAVGQLAKLAKLGPEMAVQSINESICNGWAGLFEPRGVQSFPSQKSTHQNGFVRPNESDFIDHRAKDCPV